MTIGKATLTVKADDKSRSYGSSNPALTVMYTGFVNTDNASSLTTAPTASTVATQTSNAGQYAITVGGGVSSNYNFVYQNGTLTIGKVTLTAKADDKSRTYGASNPSFTITYTGFVNTDNASSLTTAPTASTTATVTSVVGTYPITLSGGSATNYNITTSNGTLTITKASLIVKADDKYINCGSSLPTFTSTYTTFYNGDASTITSGPTYSLSPSCTGSAGVYIITPCNLQFSKSANYTVTYQTGKLYINPKGSGAKNITVALQCVDTLIGHPSGFKYVAKFKYTNSNSTTVYVPVGSNNTITGTYAGVQPSIFLSGTYQFEIYFNGSAVTWAVKTYCNNTLTTSTVTATSGSTRCNPLTGARIITDPVEEVTTLGDVKLNVFPNPATDRLVIEAYNFNLNIDQLSVYDLAGRKQFVGVNRTGNGVNLELTGLSSGLYILKIEQDELHRVISFMKQ